MPQVHLLSFYHVLVVCHIFLYEGVVLTGTHQFPVFQMFSEVNDANTSLYWLNEWEKMA